MRLEYWINSGQAAEAARGLTWFVVLVFIGIGYGIYRDIRDEKKPRSGRG